MKTLGKLIFLALGLFLLTQGWHFGTDPALPFDYAAAWAINGVLIVGVLLDLSSLVLNSLDTAHWDTSIPGSFLSPLDIAFCLVWACLNLSWFGILAILSDASVRLFNRWASHIQHQESSN